MQSLLLTFILLCFIFRKGNAWHVLDVPLLSLKRNECSTPLPCYLCPLLIFIPRLSRLCAYIIESKCVFSLKVLDTVTFRSLATNYFFNVKEWERRLNLGKKRISWQVRLDSAETFTIKLSRFLDKIIRQLALIVALDSFICPSQGTLPKEAEKISNSAVAALWGALVKSCDQCWALVTSITSSS